MQGSPPPESVQIEFVQIYYVLYTLQIVFIELPDFYIGSLGNITFSFNLVNAHNLFALILFAQILFAHFQGGSPQSLS